jgi:uncharacterized protein
MPSFLSPILRDPSHDFALINERNQAVVASRLLTAFESSTRNTGLLRHQALPAQTALILAPSGAIHTIFMKFTLYVAFVARDGRVLKVRGGLKPWRISACWGSFAVVEMAGGAMAGVSTGDRLALRSNA